MLDTQAFPTTGDVTCITTFIHESKKLKVYFIFNEESQCYKSQWVVIDSRSIISTSILELGVVFRFRLFLERPSISQIHIAPHPQFIFPPQWMHRHIWQRCGAGHLERVNFGADWFFFWEREPSPENRKCAHDRLSFLPFNRPRR